MEVSYLYTLSVEIMQKPSTLHAPVSVDNSVTPPWACSDQKRRSASLQLIGTLNKGDFGPVIHMPAAFDVLVCQIQGIQHRR